MLARCVFVALALFCALPVATQEGSEVLDPVDGDPCPGMTAQECFWPIGGGPLRPPTTLVCAAYQRNNQACYECRPATDPNTRQYLGYDVCAPVTTSASCRCENDGTQQCEGKGVCNYHAY